MTKTKTTTKPTKKSTSKPAPNPLADFELKIDDACIWFVFPSGDALPIAGPYKNDKAAVKVASKMPEGVHRTNIILAASRVANKEQAIDGFKFKAPTDCVAACRKLTETIAGGIIADVTSMMDKTKAKKKASPSPTATPPTPTPTPHKIAKFDKPTCKMLRLEIMAALKPLADKYGIALSGGYGSFASEHYTAKVSFATIGANGEANTKEKAMWKLFAPMHGFKESDLGRTFNAPGHGKAKILGWLTKSKKYQVLIEVNGKQYKYPAAAVKAALK